MPLNTIVSTDSPVCFVGGGQISQTALTADFPNVTSFVGVDGGADHLLAAGISPAAVIGDFDSLSDQARATFSNVLCHVSEQETTDFEKALIRVAAPLIYAVGFTGGRLDHTLGVLNVMARYADRRVFLVDHDDVSFVISQSLDNLMLPAGDRISLMPLDEVQVSATGLRWPLSDFAMHPVRRTSGSNTATGDPISIRTNGALLVTVSRAHLARAVTACVPAR